MLKHKRIEYNDKKKITNEQIFNMSEKDYFEMIIRESAGKPGDAQIIKEYSNDINAIIDEMRGFHDSLLSTAEKNSISIKSKVKFIKSLFECENKENVLNLLISFICDRDYLFEIKDIIRRERSKRSSARFISLKKKSTDFMMKLKKIKEFHKQYDQLKKGALIDCDTIQGNELDDEDKKFLKELFIKYVWKNIDDENVFEENLEYIHKFCTSNKERMCIYPCLMFRIFTKYRKKLFGGSLMITSKNLLNYNEYKIDKDNGKNFDTNGDYIRLFFELCNKFCEDENLEFNMFVFEMCSNLGIWYWLQNSDNTEFSYTVNSLLNIYISESDTIFDDVSDYYDEDYTIRGIEMEYEKKGQIKKRVISEDDYIDEIIEEEINRNEKSGEEYWKCCMKGRSAADRYVEQLKDKLIEKECDEFRMDSVFNRHMNYNIEIFLQNKCDAYINERIMDILDQFV